MPGPTTLSQSISGFDPRSIPGCVLWLDAADANTFTFSSGTNIATWKDKSISALTGTAINSPTATAASINSLPAVVFSGGTQYIDYGNNLNLGTNNVYIFTVVKFDSTANGAIVGKSAANGNLAGRWSLLRNSGEVGTEFIFDTGTATTNTGYADTSTNPQLISTYWDRSNTFIFQNGTQRATNALANTANYSTSYPLWVGAYQSATGSTPPTAGLYFIGKIGEIIIYQSTSPLTTSQRQAIEGYLVWKWRLEISPRYIPTAIPNCILWLDADDSATVLRSGNNITGWTDKSGLGNSVNSVSSPAPTYSASSNGIVFSAPNATFLRGNTSQTYTNDFTLFIVTTPTSNATAVAFPRLAELGTNSTTLIGQLNVAAYTATPLIGTYVGNDNNPTGFATNIQTYVNFLYNTRFLYTNASTYNTGTTTFTNLTLSNGNSQTYSSISANSSVGAFYSNAFNQYGFGAYNRGAANAGDCFDGIIHEVLIFSRLLTTTERQTIEGYLGNKWALATVPTSALPSTHPFSSIVPRVRRWTPSDMSSLPEYWFDASDPTTISASGTSLTTLSNVGSAGSGGNITVNAGTATTGTTRINGNNVIILPSGTRLVYTGNYSASNPRTHMIVTRPLVNTTTTTVGFLWQNLAANIDDYFALGSSKILEISQGYLVVIESAAIAANLSNQTSMFAARCTSATSNIASLNGSNLALLTSNAPAYNSPGGGSPFYVNGDTNSAQQLCEIISWVRSLTTQEFQQAEGYLAWKWGINTSLPTTHPFYFSPPTTSLPFSPLSIGGCQIWLDATDRNTFSVSGTSVLSWRDKVASLPFTTQGTASSATIVNGINNNPSLFLDNSSAENVYLSASLSSLITGSFFFVIQARSQRIDNFRPFATWFSGGGNFPAYGYLGSTGNNNTVGPYTTFVGSGSPTQVLTPNTNYMIFYGFNNGTTSVTTNGSTTTSGTQTAFSAAGTTSTFWLGADGTAGAQRVTLYYGEVLLYNTVLTTQQRQQVEGYLAWKWGMQNSLPSRHPFKNFPPGN